MRQLGKVRPLGKESGEVRSLDHAAGCWGGGDDWYGSSRQVEICGFSYERQAASKVCKRGPEAGGEIREVHGTSSSANSTLG